MKDTHSFMIARDTMHQQQWLKFGTQNQLSVPSAGGLGSAVSMGQKHTTNRLSQLLE